MPVMRLLKLLLIIIVALAVVFTGVIGLAVFVIAGIIFTLVRGVRRAMGPRVKGGRAPSAPWVDGEVIDVETRVEPPDSERA